MYCMAIPSVSPISVRRCPVLHALAAIVGEGMRLLGFRPLLPLYQPLDALLRAVDHALRGMADHHLADVLPLTHIC
jgi:hypothetical protein